MTTVLLSNARIFDGSNAECPEGQHVLVRDGLIAEISDRPIKAADAQVIDVGGRTLMPGMIDAHVHAYASDVNVQKVDAAGDPYRTAHAARMLGYALDCGFTTVRDIGGGDYSLWRALEDGLLRGPRYFYAGRILSMTGGHGDFRQMSESRHGHGYCSCGDFNSLCAIADGVDECLKAVREQLRRGARDRQRDQRAAHVHLGALPPRERDPPLGRVRRAVHRARHADRRRDRPFRRRAGRVHRADHDHHLRAGRAGP
jgi:imidazolonepropionase-like amidohydrolase